MEAADQACAERCQAQACKAAQSNHFDLANGIEGVHYCFNSDNCGFDMDACLTGDWHRQRIRSIVYYADYWMRTQCDNARTNETFTNGIFDWHEIPDNDPSNDPSMCSQPGDSSKDPGIAFGDDFAVHTSGMTAAVTWTLGGSTYAESAQGAALQLSYDLHDCATNARCLDLAGLSLSLPSTMVQGLLLQNTHLSVYQADVKPTLQSSGAFSYPPGTLHAIISTSAAGIPIVLRGSNSSTATGMLAPGSNAMTLSGLKFDYSDSAIAAQLQIDIVGEYVERGPTAVIVPHDVPRACTDPVTFRAASSDPDSQSLTHFWWVPDTLVDTGSTMSIVLGSGTHTIALISKDTAGRLDAAAIQYTRTCL